MKLSNQKIINVINLIGEVVAMSLPVKASYAIAKNVSKLEKEVEIYNKEREKLLNKYAEKKEDGTLLVKEGDVINIAPEHVEDWNKDITDLLNIEVEIDVHKFKLDEIINCNMSAREIQLIDFMIEE